MTKRDTHFQSGIIAPASANALFITLNKRTSAIDVDAMRQVIKQLPSHLALLQTQHPTAQLHLTIALGSDFWDTLHLDSKPKGLTPFQAIHNEKVNMPATDADFLLHIRSNHHDINYHLALLLFDQLEAFFELDEMVHGFQYLDSRDFTGFVDGTENPEGEHRKEVALVADDEPFNGGSYIHIQKYHHHLKDWKKLTLKEQEDSYGRTKSDNIEYSSQQKMSSAHTKRASAKNEKGESIEILRHSLPFGNLQESGLLFASFAASSQNFNLMLASMCDMDEQGETDKILHITHAVSGHAFFAPSLNWFEQLN